jgi:arylsulfate sulfotransferase
MKGLVIVGLVALLLTACNRLLTDEPNAIELGNELQIDVQFGTTNRDSVIVEFWESFKESNIRTTSASVGKIHSIVLLCLKAKTTYFYRIVSLANNRRSSVYSFVTRMIPNDIIEIQKVAIDSAAFEGYLLVRRFYKVGVDALIDNQGDVVWYHKYDTSVRRAFNWTNRNTIISIADTSRIIEVDLLGNTLNAIDFSLAENPRFVHHDVVLDKNMSVVVLTSDSVSVDILEKGMRQRGTVRYAGIIRTKFSGEIDWEWRLRDHVPLKAALDEDGKLRKSVGHANSIVIDNDGNYIVSFRDLSQVWKIDSDNGTVIWRLGKDGDFKMPADSYFIKQHSVHFNSRGNLMMFDNGEFSSRPISRVLELQLDEREKTVVPALMLDLPKGLSSYRMCSAYLIDYDKYLVCTTRKDAQLVVLDKSGKILWKVVMDNASYRAYHVKDPFAGY